MDVIYGRAAVGGDHIAALYQEAGAPFNNWLRVTDMSGTEVIQL